MAKNKRLIILLGIVVALVSFYLGLESWISSKGPSQPSPVIVTKPPQTQQEEPQKEEPQKPQEEKIITAKPEETKPQEGKQDLIAKTIQESKEQQKPQEATPQEPKPTGQEKQKSIKKIYTVQVGAFTNKDNATKALNKAKSMGYSGYIKEEDNFYKVIIKVHSSDIKSDLEKLRVSFGGAILK